MFALKVGGIIALQVVFLLQFASPAVAQMIFDVDDQGPLTVFDETAGPYSLDGARVLGSISGNTKGIAPIGDTFELEDGTVYMAIRFEGQNGWVEAARLRRRWQEDWGVDHLYCGGTEPFWSLNISGDVTELRINEQEFHLSRLMVREGANRRDVRELRWSVGAETWVAFISDRPTCDDGMSDYFYPLEILISDGNSEVATGALVGCCSFNPE